MKLIRYVTVSPLTASVRAELFVSVIPVAITAFLRKTSTKNTLEGSKIAGMS